MGTLIVGAIVAVIAGLALYSIHKDRKKGNGCGGGCECCSKCPTSNRK